jgi:iron(III) transport system permease protein
MTRWRLTLTALLALGVALPLAWPLRELPAGAWLDPASLRRLAVLAGNTGRLILGTLAVALPAGTLLAVLLARTDLPGRRLLAALLVLPLFIPLPLVATGWQAVLGAGGWLPLLPLAGGEWVPWSQGLGSAVFLHALAGLPWVALLVGVGLSAVEPDLEEDALTVRPPAWVLWNVSLPRAGLSVAAAGLWVALQAAGEITITDPMQVRTFAEEVYTQLAGAEIDPGGGANPLGRAVAASLAGVAVAVVAALALARGLERLARPGAVRYRRALLLRLGRWRWPLAALVAMVVGGLLAVPAGGLVRRAGLAGSPPSWSALELWRQVRFTARTDLDLLAASLGVAAVSGVLATALALTGAWLARDSRWFRLSLLILLAVAWAMPGPVLGLGLKELFRTAVEASEGVSRLPAHLLWYGPSRLPLVAVDVIRFLPFAAALVWPAVRALPGELLEACRLDGAGPFRELTGVVWPLVRPAAVRAALAVGVLSLGELSAGKLVRTPGGESFAEVIWTQMHFGVTADLAARCLVLLAVVLAGAGCVVGMTFHGRGKKEGARAGM